MISKTEFELKQKAKDLKEDLKNAKREIVQISSSDSDTIALCNDGTVWSLSRMSWLRLPDIPQDEAKP